LQPETVQPESSANMGPITTTSATNGTGQAGLVNSATGAAGVLAGWAISSLSKQMSTTEVHSTMSATTRSPIPGAYTTVSPTPSTSSTVVPSAPVPGFGNTSKSSMKLKPKVVAPVESLADEWDDGGAANAWGTDDLIDVNADTDDWAAFESAPVPEIVVPPPQSYYVKPTANGSTKPAAAPVKSAAPPVKPTPTPSPKPVSKPTMPAAPVSDGWDDDVEEPPRSAPTPPPASVTPSLANMTKEEKELEMARRREERKARIAAMKEQKKGKS
jgi:SCY1-like protein 1